MKARRIALTFVLCILGAGTCFAQSPFMGTWKLNEAKSKFGPGATKLTTVVYEAAGDSTKVTVDGTDSAGNPLHWEWTGKFDGKPYPVTGSATADSATYRKISSHALAITQTKGGKVTTTARIVVARDGKSRTVTATTIDSSGKKAHSVSVYDKQ